MVAEPFYLVLQAGSSFIKQVKALICSINVAEPFLRQQCFFPLKL